MSDLQVNPIYTEPQVAEIQNTQDTSAQTETPAAENSAGAISHTDENELVEFNCEAEDTGAEENVDSETQITNSACEENTQTDYDSYTPEEDNTTDAAGETPERESQADAVEIMNAKYEELEAAYEKELKSEGPIDDVYNGIKSLVGIGITQEMIEDEMNTYQNMTSSLAMLSEGNIEKSQEIIFENFKKELEDPRTESEAVIKYFGSEEKACEFLNSHVTEYTDKLYEAGKYMPEGANYDISYENERYILRADGKYMGVVNVNGIITDNEDEVKKSNPSDFESTYKYWTGTEYNPQNIQNYILNEAQINFVKIGLDEAQNNQTALSNTKGADEALNTFKENFANGNEDNAIEEFNNYYDMILNDPDLDIEANTFLGNQLTSIKAQKNKETGEIEYILGFNPPKGAADNYNLYSEFSEYDEQENFTVTYNPKNADKGLNNTVDDLFEQLNTKADKKGVFKQIYAEEFAKDNNGLTIDDVYDNYQEAAKLAFGESELQNIINDYIEDMDSYSGKLETALSLGLVAGSLVVPPLGVAAMASRMTDNVIDGVNIAFSDLDSDDKEAQLSALAKRTGIEGANVLTGVAINGVANGIHSALSAHLLSKGGTLLYSEVMGTASEIITDGALSIGYDLATTGDLNLSGNTFGLVLDLYSGMRGYEGLKDIWAGKMADSAGKDAADAAQKGFKKTGTEDTADNISKKTGESASKDTADDALKGLKDGAQKSGASADNSASAKALVESGLTPKHSRDIIEKGKIKEAEELLSMGVNPAYIKEITTKLESEQFDTCKGLIEEGYSPTAAKQISKLSPAQIERAAELKSKGVPDLNLADSSVLTGAKAERLDSLMEDGTVSPYYVDKFAALEGKSYEDAIALVKSGKFNAPEALEAVSDKGFSLEDALTKGVNPKKTKTEITPEIEKALTENAERLYNECASHLSEVKDTTSELFGKYKAEGDDTLSAREKGIESSMKKLVSKYEDGKIKTDPENDGAEAIQAACKEALADIYGTRLQLESLDNSSAREILSGRGIDYDDFVSTLTSARDSGDLGGKIPAEYIEALDVLKEKQTQAFVDELCAKIITGEFTITELNNYGDDITSYFTTKQVKQIAQAYYDINNTDGAPNTGHNLLKTVTKDDGSFEGSTRIDENGVCYLLSQEGDKDVAIIEHKGAIKKAGYASGQMNTAYVMDDGVVGLGEFQVRGTELNKFADCEHIPYDIRKGKITPKDTQYGEIYSIINTMSDESYKAYNSYLTRVYQTLRMQELGIDTKLPELEGVFTFKNGTSMSSSDLYAISYDNLKNFH